MFNLFKKKAIQSKDSSSFVESIINAQGAKLGTEINVSENYECLIYHNSKFYARLLSGKYKVETFLFPTLSQKQEKYIKSHKRIKFIAHFFSTKPHHLDVKIKNKIYGAEIQLKDCCKFAEFILLYKYRIDEKYALKYLAEIISELLLKNNNHDVLNKKLGAIGVFCLNCEYIRQKHGSIFDNAQQFNVQTAIQPAPPIATIENIVQENKQAIPQASNSTTVETTSSSSLDAQAQSSNESNTTCPKCGYKRKFNETFCLNCGHKLI